MIKLTLLYGHPRDEQEFERYYAQTHLPIAAKLRGVTRLELTQFKPGPGGTKPPFYRMAEIYFQNKSQLEAELASNEGRAAVADLPNFATGGVTMIEGSVDEPRYVG